MRRRTPVWIMAMAAWTVVTLGAAAALVAMRPTGVVEALLWVVVAPGVYVVASAVGEGVWNAYTGLPGIAQLTRHVETRAKGRSVSVLRVAWYVTLIAVAICVCLGLAFAIRGRT